MVVADVLKEKKRTAAQETHGCPCALQFQHQDTMRRGSGHPASLIELAFDSRVFDLSHPAITDQANPVGLKPSLRRQNPGVVLVEDHAFEAGKRVDARKLKHEAVQVALAFHRDMRRLESECGDTHKPELGFEKR